MTCTEARNRPAVGSDLWSDLPRIAPICCHGCGEPIYSREFQYVDQRGYSWHPQCHADYYSGKIADRLIAVAAFAALAYLLFWIAR